MKPRKGRGGGFSGRNLRSYSLSSDASPEDLLHSATQLHREGKLKKALEVYNQILKTSPDHPDAHYYIGTIHLTRGAHPLAELHLQRAVAADPNLAGAHNALGLLFATQRRLTEAVAAYAHTLALLPNDPIPHNNLGAVLLELERPEEAEIFFRRATILKSDYAQAYNNLGTALLALDKASEALPQIRCAVEINQNFAMAHANLGQALMSLHRLEEAAISYNHALAISPDHAETHSHLGIVLAKLDKPEQAIQCQNKAISLSPKCAEAYNNLGNIYHWLGRPNEARQSYEQAIHLSPKKAAYYLNLFESMRFTTPDQHLRSMQTLLDNTTLSPKDRMTLHFALGKALDDAGCYPESFQHQLQGNLIKRNQILYHEAKVLDSLQRTQETFTPNLMKACQGFGVPSSIPIFIVGMPRSGTTLVEQILASHPEVFGAGELNDWPTALTNLVASVSSGNEPNEIVSRTTPSFPEIFSALSHAQWQSLGEAYLRTLGSKAGIRVVRRITDKLPLNFRFLGMIHLALPNARIIHVQRDPIDTCLSCFSKLFIEGNPFTYDLGELGRYYRAYQKLMAHWQRLLPSGVMLDVSYERLVEDFEPQCRRIIHHTGLEWNPACLTFHKTERSNRTASATQVRQPIYRSSIDRWKPPQELLQPLLSGLEVTRGN